MNTLKKLALTIAALAAFQIGCGDDPVDTDTDTGKDSDNSSDEGDGGDMGTDTDNDTGTPITGDPLTADADGNIAENAWGIVGSWYTYNDNADGGTSTITGEVSATGGYCAVGEGAEILDDADGEPAYSVYWGAGIGFNLCLEAGADGTDDDVINTIGTCTSADLSNLIGFRLTVTGGIPDTELRVTFAEKGRNESTYIIAKEADIDGEVDYLFADATVAYNTAAPEIVVEDISALQFQVSTKVGASVPFDFCIEDVTPITE